MKCPNCDAELELRYKGGKEENLGLSPTEELHELVKKSIDEDFKQGMDGWFSNGKEGESHG